MTHLRTTLVVLCVLTTASCASRAAAPRSPSSPAPARALDVQLLPLDVEAATEGRIRAAEVSELIARSAEPGQSTPPVADGAPPDDAASAGAPEQSPQ